MWSAASVLVCVLDVLGRSAGTFPPIVLLDVRPPEVSSQAEAFVRSGDETIYLITVSSTFQSARRSTNKCANYDALRKLASVLVHEEWHIRHGRDERGAYAAQLTTLRALSTGPGNPVYAEVIRSMRAALAADPGRSVHLSAEQADWRGQPARAASARLHTEPTATNR